jgi:RNA polymerase sigma factor (sigma-70 family)
MANRRKVSNEEYSQAYENKEYKRVIGRVVGRYVKVLDKDERIIAGLIGLQRCLEYHDESFGQKITTSLWRFTDWECKRILKAKKSKMKMVNESSISIDSLPNTKEVSEETLFVRECLPFLNEIDRKVINQYYFDGRTFEEIGQINGYSKETARKKVNKGLDNLKKIIEKNGEVWMLNK